MPLSPATDREMQHDRQVRCLGYKRSDGLYDIEGSLYDSKSYSFTNKDRGEVTPGEPVHLMAVRLTITEDMEIVDVEAVTDAAPYFVCPAIAPAFENLKGVYIKSGFRREVLRRLGGAHGCTHLVELIIGPMATTAYQTLAPLHRERRAQRDPATMDRKINSCYAWSETSLMVKRDFPEYYTPSETVEPATDHRG